MTDSPDFFADRPGTADVAAPVRDEPQPHDLLSEVLSTVRLRGERIHCCEPAAPFAMAFDHPGGTLHIVREGSFELQLEGLPAASRYGRGDVVMLPAGRPHTLRNGSRTAAPPRSSPGGSGSARWLSGTFAFDDGRGAQLLHRLPPVIEIRGAGEQALVWLDVSAQMLIQETTAPSQGSREMIARILDLLFIQVLRAWANGPAAAPGWLTGAMDPEVGDALLAIHANPSHAWTIERLAGKSNLSRSAFAERFARRVGQPPATYIAQVRLTHAADLLLDTGDSIGAIATKVGYDSEAAFSRAFHRHYGLPPARWRRRAER
jgi:AraC-like DNA-binding protein